MVVRTHPLASLVLLLIVTATAAAAQSGEYQYEITEERASRLPQWDQRTKPEPPLSIPDARKAAESWLTSRAQEIKTWEMSSLSLLQIRPNSTERCRLTACWFYRIIFDPVVGGRRLSAGGEFTAIVLLDGSIVEPRPESGAAPASSPASPSAPVRVGGSIRPPTRIKNVNPIYPADAQADRIQGLVIVEATIGPDGKVQEAKVVRSLDPTFGLDQQAVKAASDFRFTPGLKMNRSRSS